jgi:glycosyltransferase involved in cell wall biosynthesis
MSGREPLSVVVITRDEEKNLGRCLESVAWADEIVVVDSGSTDGTIAVARAHGAVVHSEAWRGFAAQKNLAIERARHAWILSLDADEWIDARGAEEIRAVLASPSADAFAFERLSSFCGAFLERTWRPDQHVRLFRKSHARFAGGHVHESVVPVPGARVARLRSPLYHLTYRSLHDYVVRLDRYTGLAARTLRESGQPFRLRRLVFSPPAAFLKSYVLKRGFLDGTRGFIVAAGSAFYAFLKYAKAWEALRPRDAKFARLVAPTAEDPDPGAPEDQVS